MARKIHTMTRERLCSVPDCGKPHMAKGFCQAHYWRQHRAKNPGRMTEYHRKFYERRPLYGVWEAIKRRCYNPNQPAYKNYGGRGITMCDRWRNSYQAFVEDMGPKPSPKHSIDRINNDGNYEPGNCRWATAREQNLNQRRSKKRDAA